MPMTKALEALGALDDTGENAGEKERASLKTAWVIEGVLGVLYRESSSEHRIYTQAF